MLCCRHLTPTTTRETIHDHSLLQNSWWCYNQLSSQVLSGSHALRNRIYMSIEKAFWSSFVMASLCCTAAAPSSFARLSESTTAAARANREMMEYRHRGGRVRGDCVGTALWTQLQPSMYAHGPCCPPPFLCTVHHHYVAC